MVYNIVVSLSRGVFTYTLTNTLFHQVIIVRKRPPLSFPQLLKPAQKCYRSLAMIQHNINSKQKFNVTKKSLERDLINYLELRSTLLMKMEDVLGHYEQRAPQ